MKLYDLVLTLLRSDELYRDNDKALIWRVWEMDNRSSFNSISKYEFMKCTSPESIRRTRQMIQARFPELKPSKQTQEMRDEIKKDKGTFVFRETI